MSVKYMLTSSDFWTRVSVQQGFIGLRVRQKENIAQKDGILGRENDTIPKSNQNHYESDLNFFR